MSKNETDQGKGGGSHWSFCKDTQSAVRDRETYYSTSQSLYLFVLAVFTFSNEDSYTFYSLSQMRIVIHFFTLSNEDSYTFFSFQLNY